LNGKQTNVSRIATVFQFADDEERDGLQNLVLPENLLLAEISRLKQSVFPYLLTVIRETKEYTSWYLEFQSLLTYSKLTL
jgi:hypothetical protein